MAEVFGPRPRRCPSCGTEAAVAGRRCPACGTAYTQRRPRPLGTRRRRVAAAAAVAVTGVTAGAVAALLSPRIDRAKRSEAARLARAQAASDAALRRRLRRDQLLHTAALPVPASPGRLEDALRAAILDDARARVRARTMTGPVLAVDCVPRPGPPVTSKAARRPEVVSLGCLAVTAVIPVSGGSGVAGRIGDPFWARIDTATGRLAWCRITPRPGEMAIAAATVSVPLAPACDLDRPPPAGF